jgi:tetratricopeptide (TPR) repeat protein
MRRLTLLAAAFALALPAGADDFLAMKDGRIAEARKMERMPQGVLIHMEYGEIMVAWDLVQDVVIADEPAPTTGPAEDAEQIAKGLVRFDGKWIPVKQRDQLVAKRVAASRKEFEARKSRAEWRNRRVDESKVFRFETTLPDHLFEPRRDMMESYFLDFAKAWKIKPPAKEDKCTVCFHANETTYQQVSGAGGGVLGYFRFVRPYDLNIYFERLDMGQSEDVMFHEANHYLQKLINPDFAMPHFPGESIAEYYGASEWDPVKKKLTFGLVQEGRLTEIQTDIASGEMLGLTKLVSTDRMYQHYTWGWSLVHYLMNEERYASKFQKFVFALALAKDVRREDFIAGLKTCDGAEVMRVFQRELGLKDDAAVHKLETEWHEYVRSKLTLATTSGFEKAGLVAFSTGRILRSKRLLEDAIAKGSKNPIVHFRMGQILLSKGKLEEAIAAYKRVTELDPLEGRFWSALGRAISAQKGEENKKEGERLKALAAELGYDEPWAEIKLASTDDDE